MDEVHERCIRALLADELGRKVEVIVVEEHGRTGIAVELLEHGCRERRVDLDVAVVPGRVEPVIDGRPVRELPEVVVDEPEHRVRHDVVKPVVGLLVVRDQPQPERRSAARGLVQHFAGKRMVLVRDRARDPCHVVQGEQSAQRGDEAAAAAPRDPLAPVVPRERHWAAVRDDDELPAHRRTLTASSLLKRPRPPRRTCRCRADD